MTLQGLLISMAFISALIKVLPLCLLEHVYKRPVCLHFNNEGGALIGQCSVSNDIATH